MGWHGSRAGVAVLGLLFATTSAAAQESWGDDEALSRAKIESSAVPRRSFGDDPWHLMATVGFGTLVGLTGVTLGYNVHDNFELGAGMGLNAQGAMGGPYVRVRPATWTRRRTHLLHSITLDLGLSAGRYSYREDFASLGMGHTSPDDLPLYHSEFALFLQTEVSWEMVTKDGFSLRAGGGGATLLNPGNVQCDPPTSGAPQEGCGAPPKFFPVMLFQVGKAF
jgi:hypothetical protein